MEKKIYFISGHINITNEEFQEHYTDKIKEAITQPNSVFVVGDANGADYMAQKMLSELLDDPTRVTIYHIGNTPRCLANKQFNLKGGFYSHNGKDSAMTWESGIDIAWVRSVEENKKMLGTAFNEKKISGTQRNLDRRKKL